MATTPKINSTKRYNDLVRDMERSVQAVEAKERDLLLAAGQLKGTLNSIPGVSSAARATAETAVNQAYVRIERLQKKRAEAMTHMITKADTAYRALMNATADRDLGPGRGSAIALAQQKVDFTKLLKAIQRNINRQIDTSFEFLKKVETDIREVKDMVTTSVTDAVNKAFADQKAEQAENITSAVMKARLALSPKKEPLDSPETGESAPRKSSTERAMKRDKSGGKTQVIPAKTPLDSSDGDEYKDNIKNSYKRIQEASLNNRAVRALEVLASRKFSSRNTALSLLGGLGAIGLGSLMDSIWAPLKAFMHAMSPARLVGQLRKLLAFTEEKIFDLFKKGSAKVGELFEWGKAKAAGALEEGGKLLEKIGKKLGIIKEAENAGAVKAVGSIATGTGKPATLVGRAIEVLKSGASKAGGAIVEGGKWVGNKAAVYGSKAMSAMAKLGTQGYKYAKAAGSIVLDSIARLGNTPVGQFVSKWGGRLGNLGMVFSTLAGIYEEANGKPVNDMDLWDLILNPMKTGRFLGNKFNQLFEKMTGGIPVGSWLYDMFGNDPEWLKANSEWSMMKHHWKGASPETIKMVSSTTPIQTSAKLPPQMSMKEAWSNLTSGNSAPPAKEVRSANPSIVPSLIPDFAGQDPGMMGINQFIFSGN